MTTDDRRPLTFPKSHHLRKPAEFQAVYALKQRAGDDMLLVFAKPNDLSHCRVGLSVSKKQHGHAVRRNRIRRLLREAFRMEQHVLPTGLDLVLVPRPQSELTDLLPRYRKSIRRLTKKLAKRIDS